MKFYRNNMKFLITEEIFGNDYGKYYENTKELLGKHYVKYYGNTTELLRKVWEILRKLLLKYY